MNKHHIDAPSAHLSLQIDFDNPDKTHSAFVSELGSEKTQEFLLEMAAHMADMMRYASVIPLDSTGEERNLTTTYELFVRGDNPTHMSEYFEVRTSKQKQGSFAERARDIFRQGFRQGNTAVALIQPNAPKLTAVLLNESLRRVIKDGRGGLAFCQKNSMPSVLVLHKSAEPFLEELILEEVFNRDTSYVLPRELDIPPAIPLEVHDLFECVQSPADIPIWEEVKELWTKRASKISVVIPTYNEVDNLSLCITQARTFLSLACPGAEVEFVVADGGSSDNTLMVASSYNATIVKSDRGRALQMNAGAAKASGDILLFLHADTLLRSSSKPKDIRNILRDPLTIMGAFTFDFGMHGVKNEEALKITQRISSMAFEIDRRKRTKRGAIPFGDQAYFLRKEVFQALGGFPNYEIMEDYAFAKRCSLLGEITLSPDFAETSLRRAYRYDLLQAIRANESMAELFDEGASISELVRYRRRNIKGV